MSAKDKNPFDHLIQDLEPPTEVPSQTGSSPIGPSEVDTLVKKASGAANESVEAPTDTLIDAQQITVTSWGQLDEAFKMVYRQMLPPSNVEAARNKDWDAYYRIEVEHAQAELRILQAKVALMESLIEDKVALSRAKDLQAQLAPDDEVISHIRERGWQPGRSQWYASDEVIEIVDAMKDREATMNMLIEKNRPLHDELKRIHAQLIPALENRRTFDLYNNNISSARHVVYKAQRAQREHQQRKIEQERAKKQRKVKRAALEQSAAEPIDEKLRAILIQGVELQGRLPKKQGKELKTLQKEKQSLKKGLRVFPYHAAKVKDRLEWVEKMVELIKPDNPYYLAVQEFKYNFDVRLSLTPLQNAYGDGEESIEEKKHAVIEELEALEQRTLLQMNHAQGRDFDDVIQPRLDALKKMNEVILDPELPKYLKEYNVLRQLETELDFLENARAFLESNEDKGGTVWQRMLKRLG